MPDVTADSARDTIAIVRQPVFDDKRHLWGYLLCCLGTGSADLQQNEKNVAVDVAGSAFIGLQQIIDHNKKAIIQFSGKNIMDRLPYALPPALTVVQITEEIYQHPSVPPVLNQLKSDGYLLSVTGFSGHAACEPLYRLADIIGIETTGKTKAALSTALSGVMRYPAIRLAMQVADADRFGICRELGFKLFQGSFFKSLESVTVRKLSSNEISRFNLMHAIEKEEVDIDQLAEIIQSDAALSFRLLAYLNSAGFGLRQKVQSIPQAVALLGWRKIRTWLRVVLLNDVNQSTHAPELMLLAAQRGKFLELIAQEYDYWGFDPESLHMLGIFSLLDAMLGTPMAEIVGYLPLDDKLKSALRREPNNEYVPLLELAEYFEEGRWEQVDQRIQELNLDVERVRRAFQRAIDWAAELTMIK
jgi:EAL and modified HD-GYP domain-containing signal transduction protein